MRYCLVFLLLLPFYCFGQHVAISATKMNVLYIGIPNPVSFAVENAKCNELTLVVESGTAKRTGECEYIVTVTKPGNTIVSIVKGKDTLGKTIFRSKYIPDPVTAYTAKGPNWFSLDSLRVQTGLLVTIKKFEFDTSYTVISFRMVAIRDKQLGGDKKIYCAGCSKKIDGEYYETIFTEENEGTEFNTLLKEFLGKKLMPGDRIYIEDIKARAPDGGIRYLNPISFRVQ